MTANEIRQKFLEFFKGKGHTVIPSASLIPENDPSVLFTTAGMHPLVPYLLGENHPGGKRLVDIQKCVRTGDIDEVGDYSHHTFFEMLGNWSLGDYFKKEIIEWSYEFLTSLEWLGLDKNRIAISVFEGDKDAPFDDESYEAWKKLGIDEKKIARLPKKNNWWGPVGDTGPCGPDTEMFCWAGDLNKIPESFDENNPLWLEIWNDVFMQYDKTKNDKFEQLSQKNVDTGMGLERTLAVVNGLDDNYKTELFWPIIQKIEELSGRSYDNEQKAMRIIADHLKAATFILGDEKGIMPSNTGQGYVLRRLIRRAVRYGKQLGIRYFTFEIAQVVIEMYKDIYPELLKNKNFVLGNLSEEEEKFEKTLEKGLKEFDKGTSPFILFTTYGFPLEMTKELAKERGTTMDEEEFYNEFKKHQELSQTASAGMFKGGLSDVGEENIKLHTATHLLRQALEEVFGEKIIQKGSNITTERLRFDFTHNTKMTDEEKKKVEELVNEKIKQKLSVNKIIMKKEEAKKTGASHSFADKYGDEVSVYYIGDSLETAYSKEFCGGPHVENTGELGHFKIVKEEAVSAGIRRIKAILE
ncbi:MAG: alanine--tRNA ligase [Candidatus Zambryskibacteria bacterium]|nr:alanine--tRNA ligase [Candidatus Zambryskibacteria bacterium]